VEKEERRVASSAMKPALAMIQENLRVPLQLPSEIVDPDAIFTAIARDSLDRNEALVRARSARFSTNDDPRSLASIASRID